MKKFLVLLLLFLIVAGFNIYSHKNLAELNLNSDFTYVLYTTDSKVSDYGYNWQKNGNSFIVSADKDKSQDLLGVAKKVSGEALVFEGFVNKVSILNDLQNNLRYRVVSTELINNALVLNCYSDILQNKVSTKHGKVNLQIAITNDRITAGYPLILHSF